MEAAFDKRCGQGSDAERARADYYSTGAFEDNSSLINHARLRFTYTFHARIAVHLHTHPHHRACHCDEVFLDVVAQHGVGDVPRGGVHDIVAVNPCRDSDISQSNYSEKCQYYGCVSK